MGSPAVVLYINDETVKIRDKLNHLKLMEKEQVEI